MPVPGKTLNTLNAIFESLFNRNCPFSTVALTPGTTVLLILFAASTTVLPVNVTSTPFKRRLSPAVSTGVYMFVITDKLPLASPGESLVIVNCLLTETPTIVPEVVTVVEDM